MWLPLLLITVAFTNVKADVESDMQDCLKRAGIEDIDKLNDLPQSLDAACPLALGLFSCMEDVVLQYTGFTVEQLGVALEGTDAARGIIVFTNARITLEELCDENSQLHQDYKESEDCFIEAHSKSEKLCKEEAQSAYEAIQAIENEVQEAAGENPSEDNSGCMLMSYEIACNALDIRERCGKKAFDTFREIIRKTSFFRNGICTGNQLLSAKDKLVQGLQLSDTERELYDLAFDLKKKRRK